MKLSTRRCSITSFVFFISLVIILGTYSKFADYKHLTEYFNAAPGHWAPEPRRLPYIGNT